MGRSICLRVEGQGHACPLVPEWEGGGDLAQNGWAFYARTETLGGMLPQGDNECLHPDPQREQLPCRQDHHLCDGMTDLLCRARLMMRMADGVPPRNLVALAWLGNMMVDLGFVVLLVL